MRNHSIFAFRIGSYEVSKHGVLIFEEDEQTATVLEALEAAGFAAEQPGMEVPVESTEPQAEEPIEFVHQKAEMEEFEQQATDTDVMEQIADDKLMAEVVAGTAAEACGCQGEGSG